jgi:hypothetical protein
VLKKPAFRGRADIRPSQLFPVFCTAADETGEAMRLARLARYVWALPTTAVGVPLLLAALLSGGRARWVEGVVEVRGGLAAFYLRHVVGLVLKGGASAMTLGHIVLGRDQLALDSTRFHERIHVHQCERWGPLFIPAYLTASLYQRLRGRDAYRDNPFERQAFAATRQMESRS